MPSISSVPILSNANNNGFITTIPSYPSSYALSRGYSSQFPSTTSYTSYPSNYIQPTFPYNNQYSASRYSGSYTNIKQQWLQCQQYYASTENPYQQWQYRWKQWQE